MEKFPSRAFFRLTNRATIARPITTKQIDRRAIPPRIIGVSPMRDFSRKTLSALARKGMTVIGLTVIPNPASDLPFATGERGYKINDNGCMRILSFAEVLELAA